MALSVLNGDLNVTGTLRAAAVSLPQSCVGDSQVSGSSPLSAGKTRHRYAVTESQAHGSAAVGRRAVARVAHAPGEVVALRVGVTVACVGDSTVSVDLTKNGTTILSAPVLIDSGDAPFTLVSGVVSSESYVAGDVFEVVVSVAAGTGTLGQGVFADVVFDELAG